MSRPVKLKYHQATFDLLGEQPIISDAAVSMMQKWEKRTGLKVPSAIKEWYSFEGAEERFRKEGVSDLGNPVRNLLKSIQAASHPKSRSKWIPVGGLEDLRFARLDGSANPPVTIDCDFDVSYEGSFSQFVFRSIFERLVGLDGPDFPPLTAQVDSCGPITLDFIRERFREGLAEVLEPREMPNPFRPGEILKGFWRKHPKKSLPGREASGPRRHDFYFFRTGIQVCISCQGDPTKQECVAGWFLRGDTIIRTEELARELWPWGTLSRTLQGRGKDIRAMLQRLRRKLGQV
jgi:hypothetical protein